LPHAHEGSTRSCLVSSNRLVVARNESSGRPRGVVLARERTGVHHPHRCAATLVSGGGITRKPGLYGSDPVVKGYAGPLRVIATRMGVAAARTRDGGCMKERLRRPRGVRTMALSDTVSARLIQKNG
jgi:hypothetical protein